MQPSSPLFGMSSMACMPSSHTEALTGRLPIAMCRPADKDCALDGSLMIGVPAGAFSLPERRLSYYLVTLRPGTARLSAARQLPFEGLQLGQQLGRGMSLTRSLEGFLIARGINAGPRRADGHLAQQMLGPSDLSPAA